MKGSSRFSAWPEGRVRRTAVCFSLAGALLGGCKSPEEKIRTGAVPPERLVAGTSVEGRPIECVVLGGGAEVTLILATIHGNESAGTPLVWRLLDHLSSRPELLDGRRVVLMPVANPDGLAKGIRHNVRGVDLNRNFPATNYADGEAHGLAALSEPESVAIHRLMWNYRPDRIVSLHQPANHGEPCIDFDGPADSLAKAMASKTNLPITKLGGRPGSLGSYAGITLGVPIVTVELPNEASHWAPDELWQRYGGMLLAAVRFPKHLGATEIAEDAARGAAVSP